MDCFNRVFYLPCRGCNSVCAALPRVPLFRPVALFFIFEGVWMAANYLVTQLWPGTDAMQWIHYTGIIVFGGYLLICLFYSRPKKSREERSQGTKKKKTSRRDRRS